MKPTIRLATPEDYLTIVQAEGTIFGSDAWSELSVRDELEHPHSYYLLAEDEAGMVGYAGLRLGPGGGQGDIQTVAVAERARGKGLGGRLVDALLDKAVKSDLADVLLEVRADNDIAHALYVSRGFREIARRPGYYQPDGVDAIVMAKNLKPGANQ